MPQHSKGEISSVLEQGDFLFNMKGRNSFAVFFLLATLNAAIGYQCNERPRKLGCFKDSQTDKLMTYKFRVHMKKSDWSGEKWNLHLDKLLCKCSEEAKKGSYMYFGLQHYYECWVGNLKHVQVDTRKLNDESECWSKNPDPLKCKAKDQVCVGKESTMLIYEVSYSSYIIPDTEEPTRKVMMLPKKNNRPPPFIPVFPGKGKR